MTNSYNFESLLKNISTPGLFNTYIEFDFPVSLFYTWQTKSVYAGLNREWISVSSRSKIRVFLVYGGSKYGPP